MTDIINKFTFLHFDEIDSTNNYLKQNRDVLPNLTVVSADLQTAGRGRMGKSFHSPKGTGLYFSLLIKEGISSEISKLLTVMTAVAVFDEIKKYTDKDVKIKWVNDIYIGGKKVCGILTEGGVNMQNNVLDYAVIGIGINLVTPKNGFAPEIADIVDTVFENEYDMPKKSEIINGIVCRIYKMLTHEDISFIDKYRANSYLDGRKINIIRENSIEPATALYIDENCNLVVKNDVNGEILSLFSGDVSIRLN